MSNGDEDLRAGLADILKQFGGANVPAGSKDARKPSGSAPAPKGKPDHKKDMNHAKVPQKQGAPAPSKEFQPAGSANKPIVPAKVIQPAGYGSKPPAPSKGFQPAGTGDKVRKERHKHRDKRVEMESKQQQQREKPQPHQPQQPHHTANPSAAVQSSSSSSSAGNSGPKPAMSGRLGAGGPWYTLPQTTLVAKALAPAAVPDRKKLKTGAAPEPAPQAQELRPPTPAELTAMRAAAAAALEAEVSAHETRGARDNSADSKWMRTVLSAGTAADRLAALTLLVSGSPLHGLRHLDGLLALANKAVRRESQSALEALKDVFVNNLLPEDRKLLPLSARPATGPGGAPHSPDTLALWAFEDGLKTRYASLVGVLSRHLGDSLPHFKTAALGGVATLLAERPEGEAALLGLLVNKLGDPDGKVASKASFHVGALVEKHPAMKPVIAREVTQFLTRPGLGDAATYHGVLVLNQLPLSRSPAGAALAGDLIATYFMTFEAAGRRAAAAAAAVAAKQRAKAFSKAKGRHHKGGKGGKPFFSKGGGGGKGAAFKHHRKGAPEGVDDGGRTAASALLDTKLLSALLTGVNRAFPYAVYAGAGDAGAAPGASGACAAALARIESRADSIFTAVHSGSFNTAVQALMLLQQVAAARLELEGRGKPAVGGDAPAPYLPGQGPQGAPAPAVAAPAATPAPVAAHGGLDSFLDRFYRALYSTITLASLGSTSKHALFLNLVFKAASRDPHAGRARALVKRLVQVALHLPPHVAAGVVFLVSELTAARADLRGAITEPEGGAAAAPAGAGSGSVASSADGSSDSEGEKEEEEEKEEEGDAAMGGAGAAPSAPGAPAAAVAAVSYDPLKREPRFAGAERSCLWELAPLALHFHPSVRRFADAVLSAPAAALSGSYGGDPLSDFSLMAFLDRVVYKNPKKRDVDAAAAAAGTGAQEPALDELALGYAIVQGADPDALKALAAGLVHGRSAMQRKGARHGRVDAEAPATAAAFAAADPASVRPEDAFLHTFFRSKAAAAAAAAGASAAGGKKRGGGEGSLAEALGEHGGDDDSEAGGSVGGDADEDEMDAFADKLAEGLLRSSNNGGGGAGPSGEDDPLDEWMLQGPAGGGGSDGEEAGSDAGSDALDGDEGEAGSDDEDEEGDEDGLSLEGDEESDDEDGSLGSGEGEEGAGDDEDDDDDDDIDFADEGQDDEEDAAAGAAGGDDSEGGEGSDSEDSFLAGASGKPRKKQAPKAAPAGGSKKGAPSAPPAPLAGRKRDRASVFADADAFADALQSDDEGAYDAGPGLGGDSDGEGRRGGKGARGPQRGRGGFARGGGGGGKGKQLGAGGGPSAAGGGGRGGKPFGGGRGRGGGGARGGRGRR